MLSQPTAGLLAEAERALAALAALLAELGLELRPTKDADRALRERGEGLDFFGFHHRSVGARAAEKRPIAFLAR